MDNGLDLILHAAAFAAEKHRHQRRKGAHALPYINHPLAVAQVLSRDARVQDPIVLAAALLHDTIEDTDTTRAELETHFGPEVAAIVAEVTDDKSLPKPERKRLQIEHAGQISPQAQLVKLADKICNLRDMTDSPPDWPLERKREYYEWARSVVAGLCGVSRPLGELFDAECARKP